MLARWYWPWLVMLYVIVITLAVMVAANRHEARQLFVEVQQLERDRDQLNATWSRYVLEQSTQLNQLHVESRAVESLNMQKPVADNTRVIRE
ncbi:cell division protein FtsL [Thiolinea disciformis]|uniref:cell division protein FtsL n=1 Tax=Thiolinea disciformis TaxID=125614 RepID=UPI000373BD67|nr:cell division protein FtsL [Thiolinea disciformis]